MIHAEAVRTVDLSRHNGHFKRPLYTDYSFARLPRTGCRVCDNHLP